MPRGLQVGFLTRGAYEEIRGWRYDRPTTSDDVGLWPRGEQATSAEVASDGSVLIVESAPNAAVDFAWDGILRVVAHLGFLVPIAIWLFAISDPAATFAVLIALPLGAVFVLVWVIWAITCLCRRRVTWWLTVGLLAATAVLTIADAPLQVPFAMHQKAFDHAVATMRPSDLAAEHSPGQIGGYDITSVQALPGDGIAFFVSIGDFLVGDTGFAYLPTSPPPNFDGGLTGGKFDHLRGHWYVFSASSD